MTRTVSSLEELGLVVREPHEVDRRLAVVRITEAGLGRTAADRKRRDAWLAHRLRELTPEERKQLRGVLPILEKLTRS
jgi:DNA-binding MarR family transcriptional regulator